MSSPSETQSQKSEIVSSPQATDVTYEDTASSIQAVGAPPGVTVQWLTNNPNAAFGALVNHCTITPGGAPSARTDDAVSSYSASVALGELTISDFRD